MSVRLYKSLLLSRGMTALLLALPAMFALIISQPAHAAALSQVMVRFDRIKISTPTTGTVCAKPATNLTEADVQVTFPTGYSLGAFGTFTVDTTNLAWPSGGTIWPGIGTATDVTGQVVTFPSGELTVGTLYCFNWINSAAVSIKSGATASNSGTVTTRASGPTTIDSSTYNTASISDDQIVVTATVPSTFSFALNANTDALGTLSTGAVTSSPSPRTVTINTNAGLGWMAWAKDDNTGLNSSSASSTIASTSPGSNSTLSIGSPGYNTGVTQTQAGGTGTITIAAPFVGTGTGQGGGLDTSLRTIASSTGTADTAVLTLKNNVTIGPTTPAATDYRDVITVIGGGLF